MLNQMVVTSITDVFTVDSHKGRRVKMINRNSYGITFCYGGESPIIRRGTRVVSDRNHMVLLPQGQDYFLHCDSSGLFPVVNVRCTEDFQVARPTAFPLQDPDSYLKDYERLRELYFLGNHSARCMSVLYQMIAGIASEPLGDQSVLGAAMEFLERHYADPHFTNASIASHLHISEAYFRRLFKERYGVAPKQYILNLRLRKARQLLSERWGSVTEIAESCGFSSVYHFSRAFCRGVGVSPTQYSRSQRKDAI